MSRILANVVATGQVQAGIQPGLKARAPGQSGPASPFAAFLAGAGAPDTQDTATVSTKIVAGVVSTPPSGASADLRRPLRLLAEIADTLAAAATRGEDLADTSALPDDITALLADFAALPQEALAALGDLIGPERVAALSGFAETLQESARTGPAPREGLPASSLRDAPAASPGTPASTQPAPATPAAATPAMPLAPASTASATPGAAGRLSQDAAPTPAPATTALQGADVPAPQASVQDRALHARQDGMTSAAAGQESDAAPQNARTAAEPKSAAAIEVAGANAGDIPAANTAAAAPRRGEAATAPATQQPASVDAAAAQRLADAVAAATGAQDAAAAERARTGTRPASERDATATTRTFLQDVIQGTQQADTPGATPAVRSHAANSLAQAIREALAGIRAAAPGPESAGLPADASPGLPAIQGADTILLGTDRPGQMMAGQTAGRSVTVSAYGASLPVSQIAVAVSSQARAGARHFEIRLDPPEMGRIDVRLEMARDGTMNAQLTVDRPETFEALNRDARHLERMLQQSGMKIDGGNIQFSLRDGGGSGQGAHEGNRAAAPAFASRGGGEDEAQAAPVYARISPTALVDIQV